MHNPRAGLVAPLVLFLAAAPAALLAADEPGFSLAGSGLLTFPSTATLPPGRSTAGIALDNADRDPQGLDLLDYDLVFAVGVTPRLEAYGRGAFSRVVAMPELPTLPPPPLDVLVAPGAQAPAGPFHSLYFPIPYVNKRGTARFGDFVPGDAVVGAKLRLSEGQGAKPALAAGLEVKIPLTKKLEDLQSGAGTGGVDLSARVMAEWRLGRTSLSAATTYTRVGAPAFGDRIFSPGAVRDVAFELPDRLDVGVGLRRFLTARLAGVVEVTTFLEIGKRTKVADSARPVDFLAGIQRSFGRLRLTLGLRYHGNSLPSMASRSSPLAGLVDLTDVAERDLAGYLQAVGLPGAAPGLRPGSQKIVAVPAGAPKPPPGARVIGPTYRIRSEHQVGSVVLLGWSF